MVQRLIPEFERRNPAIRVRVQQIPWSAAHEKLLTAFVGESMPDVFQVGNTWIPEFAALDAVEPLDARIAASAAVTPGDYFAGILATNTIGGTTYALPWYVDTRLLFYRSDILAAAGYPAAPRSWADWLQAMRQIKERGGGNGYAILLPIQEWEAPVILAMQLGAHLLREGGRYGNFRSPAFRRAFAFYLDLFRQGLAPQAGAAQVANVYQEFARGYFGFYLSGPWNIGEFRRRLPPEMNGKWATAPMPSPDAAYPGTSLAGGASLALSRTSRQKDAAWRLIEYLADPARQAEFYRLTGDLPSRQSAWAADDLAHQPYTAAFWEQLHAVQPAPQVPEWEQIASKVAEHSEAAVRGSVGIDAALHDLDHDVDQILEKRRWMLRRSEGEGATPAAAEED